MPFWSSQTLKVRIPGDQLVVPYDENRVTHSAYEMRVGPEAFVTSNSSNKTQVTGGGQDHNPSGTVRVARDQRNREHPRQRDRLYLHARWDKVPGTGQRFGIPRRSGYRGQLKFAVYNAGSRTIALDQDQRIFMIWFADLGHPDDNPYPDRPQAQVAITSDDVARIQGDVASPALLKKELEQLRADLDKKFTQPNSCGF